MGYLLDQAFGRPTPYTPVWLMRQAGRYMPEYRKVREKHTFLDMCYKAEVACEVTMQPIDAFGLDAAILFNDILPPLVPMGLDLEFQEKKGPVIHNPIRLPEDVNRIKICNAKKDFDYAYEAVSMIRKRLDTRKDLIGFAGAPFTLASYCIEGGSSKEYRHIKKFMWQHPEAFHELMKMLTVVTREYLQQQVRAGADLVQLFDSWGGVLSREDYIRFAKPYNDEIVRYLKTETKAAVILFVKGADGYFDVVADCQADVMGCGWQLPLDTAARLCGNSKTLQGNFDPAALFAPKEIITHKVKEILASAKNVRGHIFNLGHGIMTETPVDHVRHLVDTVQKLSLK